MEGDPSVVSLIQWKKLKVTCFVKQNEIAWFSVSIATLHGDCDICSMLFILFMKKLKRFDPVKILFYRIGGNFRGTKFSRISRVK